MEGCWSSLNPLREATVIHTVNTLSRPRPALHRSRLCSAQLVLWHTCSPTHTHVRMVQHSPSTHTHTAPRDWRISPTQAYQHSTHKLSHTHISLHPPTTTATHTHTHTQNTNETPTRDVCSPTRPWSCPPPNPCQCVTGTTNDKQRTTIHCCPPRAPLTVHTPPPCQNATPPHCTASSSSSSSAVCVASQGLTPAMLSAWPMYTAACCLNTPSIYSNPPASEHHASTAMQTAIPSAHKYLPAPPCAAG